MGQGDSHETGRLFHRCIPQGVDKEINAVYNSAIRRSGISLSEFWILLMVREGVSVQKEIARQLFWSKQTVNSACSKLVDRGLILLTPSTTDRRERVVVLTEKGMDFSRKYIGHVEMVEEEIWQLFTPEERRLVVELLERYCRQLRQGLETEE